MTTVRLRYINRFRDRHGKERHYFRPPGGVAVPLPGRPGSPEYLAAYYEAAKHFAPKEPGKKTRGKPGTFERLAFEYYNTTAFKMQKPDTRRAVRGIIDAFIKEHGHRLVAQMRYEDAEKIISGKAATPAAANNLLKRLRALMKLAIRLKWRTDDPTREIAFFPSGTFHTWTEEELAAYERRWPVGTMERTAFALALHTGQRKSDIVKMRWSDYNETAGTITLTQKKTDQEAKDESIVIPIHPQLQEALRTTPRRHGVILTTRYGQPFTSNGFGNWMADKIGASGVPDRCVLHGLRKAAARRLAEAGCSTMEIMSITGHKSIKEVERYVAAARQKLLAKAAVIKMTEHLADTELQTSPAKSTNPFTNQIFSTGDGEPGGTRTHDQGLKRPLLYRLSYRLTPPARSASGRAGRTLGRGRTAVNTARRDNGAIPPPTPCGRTVRSGAWPPAG